MKNNQEKFLTERISQVGVFYFLQAMYSTIFFKLKLLVKVENDQSNEYDDDGGDGNSIVYDI